jgi:hypothetical protein
VNRLLAAYRTLSTTPVHRTGARVLQCIMGLVTWYRLTTELRFAPYFWGPHGLGGNNFGVVAHGVPAGAWMHTVFATDARMYVALAVQGIAAACLIFGYATRAATLVLLVTFSTFEGRLPDITDGGDNVMALLLVYTLGFLGPRERPAPGGARVWVHNLAVVAVAAQILIIYSAAAFYKFEGHVWQNGTALYVVSQVDRFTTPLAQAAMKNALVCTLSTYATLAWQILFPLAVFTPIRRAWLAIGVLFHLGIVGMMGLVTFSAIMIGLELFLLDEADYAALGELVRRVAQRGRAWRAAPIAAGGAS